MPAVLPEIVAHKLREIEDIKRSMRRREAADITYGDGSFERALSGDELKLIAEIKPSSPSAGTLRASIDPDNILRSYNSHADAVSVLTDRKYFGGSIELLSYVSSHSFRPTLCKDFVLDACQVRQARSAGAQAVLLIAKILDDPQLAQLHSAILELGMAPVVEVQTAEEVRRALAVSPRVMLINNRDLTSFEIDLSTTERLVPLIPADVITISASGIQSRSDIERLLPCCTKFLVGSSLMQSDDIEGKLRELTGK